MASRKRRANEHTSNIRRYRKPLNINLGMVIFVVLLIYLLLCVLFYFNTNHIVRYEVKKGSLATNHIYRGIIIRDEEIIPIESRMSGYVNYYANEGERVAVRDLVYIVDETGRLSEELANEKLEENSLTDKQLAEFRTNLTNFSHGYDPSNYKEVYDFKNTLNSTVVKLANVNMLDSVEQLSAAANGSVISRCYASKTGIVSYWTDGYEDLKPEQVNLEMFDRKEYDGRRRQLLSNTLAVGGDPAYKLSKSEEWSLVIPVENPEKGAALEAEKYIKVRFLENQYESWGAVKLLNNPDGKSYIQLTFTNSMLTFLNDRFLEVELLLADDTGLKIPNSAIVDKEFFLIPEEFVTPWGDEGKGQVIRQYVMDDGKVSSKNYEISLYSYDPETRQYYVDATILESADVLLKEDGQDNFVVSTRATLTGVYNVNNGYADFRQISILAQNDEYAIVNANTRYGLNVYDYIALNADSVHDDQFINK